MSAQKVSGQPQTPKEIGDDNEKRVISCILAQILVGHESELKTNVTLHGLLKTCSQELDAKYRDTVVETKTGGMPAVLQNLYRKLEALKLNGVNSSEGLLNLKDDIRQLHYYLCTSFTKDSLLDDFKMMMISIFIGDLVKNVTEGTAVFPEGTKVGPKHLVLPTNAETNCMFRFFWSFLTDNLTSGFVKVFHLDNEDVRHDMTPLVQQALDEFFSSPLVFRSSIDQVLRTIANLFLENHSGSGQVELTTPVGVKVVKSKLPELGKIALLRFYAHPESVDNPVEFLYSPESIATLLKAKKVIDPQHPTVILAEMLASGLTLDPIFREFLLRPELPPPPPADLSVGGGGVSSDAPFCGPVTEPLFLKSSSTYRVTVSGDGESAAQIVGVTQQFSTAKATKGVFSNPFVVPIVKGKPVYTPALKVVLSNVKSESREDIVFLFRDGEIEFVSGVDHLDEKFLLTKSDFTLVAVGSGVSAEELV